MAIEWSFPSNNFGTLNGIGEAGIETFKGAPYRSLAREISEAVPFFRKFYRSRIEKGLPAELKSSIYSDLNVDDARILANITRNPLNALLLSNYFEYDSVTQRFGFKAEVWSGITEVGRSRMADAANARLAKYYQDL